MNEFEQLLNQINSLDDGETRSNLVKAFDKAKLANDTLKTTRKELGNKLTGYESFNKKILESLELDADANVDDVLNKFKDAKTSGNADFELERQKIEDKYNNQTLELRDALTTEKNQKLDLEKSYKNLEFNTLINDSGIMGDAINNPMMKKAIADHLKSQLLVKDGSLFVDNGDGDVAVNSITNEKISPNEVISKMKEDKLWQPFFQPNSTAQGMGTKPSVTTAGGLKKPDQLSESERIDLYKTNPTEFKRLYNN